MLLINFPGFNQPTYYLLVVGFLLILIIIGLYQRFRFIKKIKNELAEKNKIIQKERDRSEKLLLNILPEATATELKEKGSSKARYYDLVTVLFTDISGFTKIAESLSPTELVSEIDFCYRKFDEIISKYKVEKIKTIGDSYMCAGGLPVPSASNPVDMVHVALEMKDAMTDYNRKKYSSDKPPFEIRIGIHTGPVVAGIVGITKFSYDIWGDTVNTASRMESSGEIGRINISGSTHELVKDHFVCTHRGKIMAKNKGEVDMYFVDGTLDEN